MRTGCTRTPRKSPPHRASTNRCSRSPAPPQSPRPGGAAPDRRRRRAATAGPRPRSTPLRSPRARQPTRRRAAAGSAPRPRPTGRGAAGGLAGPRTTFRPRAAPHASAARGSARPSPASGRPAAAPPAAPARADRPGWSPAGR
eukprot:scaffold13311_cov82-Isochrysis_galbana.AAC.2